MTNTEHSWVATATVDAGEAVPERGEVVAVGADMPVQVQTVKCSRCDGQHSDVAELPCPGDADPGGRS